MADAELLDRDCGPLVGLSISDVMNAIGLPPGECSVFDEPPCVGRGVEWWGPGGLWVTLWVARQAGLFSPDRDWALTEFLALRAVGIRVRHFGQPGRGGEWWAGGSRFSPPSQLAE